MTLEQLADYLDTVPQEEFSMWDYKTCVIGHACRLFGCTLAGARDLLRNLSIGDLGINNPKYVFICGAEWANIDNTPQGAAGRIRYCMNHGVGDWRTNYSDYVRQN
jgi:hypothetical protein